MLINFDLKQIEIVVLAYKSGDELLISLIKKGQDLYKFFAAVMYDKPEEEITKEERDSLKAPILGISYGRGANALAEESGQTKEWCQDFIDRFYDMFPKVREMHDRWIREVDQTGYLQMEDGIRFKFKKYIWNNKTKQKEESTEWRAKYWQPEIKNYPIQHTAFIILSTYVATFWREKAIHNRHKYLLINTVHDSLMLDCRPEYVEDCLADLNEILDKLPEILYNELDMRIDVPIKADIQVGESWYDCA